LIVGIVEPIGMRENKPAKNALRRFVSVVFRIGLVTIGTDVVSVVVAVVVTP